MFMRTPEGKFIVEFTVRGTEYAAVRGLLDDLFADPESDPPLFDRSQHVVLLLIHRVLHPVTPASATAAAPSGTLGPSCLTAVVPGRGETFPIDQGQFTRRSQWGNGTENARRHPVSPTGPVGPTPSAM